MTSYINLTISSRLHTTVENFCTLFHLWTILRRHGQRENYPRLKNITFSRGPKFGFCVGSLMVLRRLFFHVWTNIYIKIRRLLLNNIWKLCQESFSFLLRERRGLVQAVRHHRINHVRRNVNGAANFFFHSNFYYLKNSTKLATLERNQVSVWHWKIILRDV